jgi:ankyrin repeat protein
VNMNPLSDKTGETPQFPEIKNQKSQKDKTTTNISKEVFDKMMQDFGNKEDDKDDLLTQIGNKIAESRCFPPPDSPFADTDMIVFKDDYHGYLPRNGIRESDLKQITKVYNDVFAQEKGPSRIRIDGSEKFRDETLICIKTLMTREIGRKLINKLISLGSYIWIESGSTNMTDGKNFITFNLTPEMSMLRLHPSGKLKDQENPPFLSLAHEMIHIIHLSGREEGDLTYEEKDVDYDNLEEKVTITGFKKEFEIPKAAEDEKDWSSIVHDYDELNERIVTEAFTGSLTEFFNVKEKRRYPRVGHHVIIKNNRPLYQLLKDLIQENVTYSLEKLIKKKGITKDTIDSLFKPGELHTHAIEHGRVEALKLLMKIDPNPVTEDEGSSLLHIAAQKGKNLANSQKLHPIIDAVLETNIDVNLPDLQGYTAVHHFTQLGDIAAVQKLVKKGGNIHLKNEFNNQDPFDYALGKIVSRIGIKASPELKSQLHTLYQLMKEIYSKKELIQKLIEPEFAKKFLIYGDQKLILDYLDILHESGYDLSNLDETGNSITHYAVLSRMPIVINKLKQQYKLDMNIKNQDGETLPDYLIDQFLKFVSTTSMYSRKDGELFFDSIYNTLQALEVDLSQYKKSFLLICDEIGGPAFNGYVKKLFQKQ